MKPKLSSSKARLESGEIVHNPNSPVIQRHTPQVPSNMLSNPPESSALQVSRRPLRPLHCNGAGCDGQQGADSLGQAPAGISGATLQVCCPECSRDGCCRRPYCAGASPCLLQLWACPPLPSPQRRAPVSAVSDSDSVEPGGSVRCICRRIWQRMAPRGRALLPVRTTASRRPCPTGPTRQSSNRSWHGWRSSATLLPEKFQRTQW